MYRNTLVLLFSLCIFCISGDSQKLYYVSTEAGDTADIYKGVDSNAGYRDGITSFAKFNAPTAIATDTLGNLYIADTYNNVIRKINTTFNTVTTIAGDTNGLARGFDSSINIGYLNGPAMAAKFSQPLGICVDKFGNVYVADTYNNVIRKISTSGIVTTYAGKDSSGTTFAGYKNGADSVAEFNLPMGITVDTGGNLFVADYGNNTIREISAAGMVTTFAGQGYDTSYISAAYVNGPIDTAQFIGLYGITQGPKGEIYVSQFINGVNAIRRVYHDTVTTYVGYDTIGFDTNVNSWPDPYGNNVPSGYQNGKQVVNRNDTAVIGVLLNGPMGIAFDTTGNMLIADEFNNVIRQMNPKDSIVTTFAGKWNDSVNYSNNWDSLAAFYNPIGIAADRKGNIYVSDVGNNVIRKIKLQSVTGIASVKKPVYTMNVYPNPCNDRLNIVSSFNGKADLLDVTGRIIWTNIDFKSPYTLSTSAISPGVYFLRISSPSITEIRKIEVVK